MSRLFHRYWFAAVILAATLAIYLPGLDNALLFDDALLQYGNLFQEYGNVLQFKYRMLSYGSFVWLQDLAGPGWWKQRLLNIALHLGVLVVLWAFLRQLLAQVEFPHDMAEQSHFAPSRHAALLVALAVFALHPMSVYAVAYLIQRSILMATLLALTACWAFVHGLQTQRPWWFAAALLAYIGSILSKEYGIMTAAFAVPLYIYLRRPGPKAVAAIAAGSFAVVALATVVFYQFYSHFLGKPFDPQSVAFTEQLQALHPGFASQVYPLSILNEAALFLAYGVRWVLPYPGWMSVDMRPVFPLGWNSAPHLLGALAYVALGALALWALLRQRHLGALLGLLLLLPVLWYFTEFSTVWIQDPFVLYRSYLWATVLPGFVALALTGFKPRTIYVIGLVLVGLLTPLAVERVSTLKDENTAWQDVIEKTDLQAPPNAVGRSRAYVNLGNYQLKNNLFEQAIVTLKTAVALNDPGVMGAAAHLNLGAAYQKAGQPAQALQALSTPQALSYQGVSLPYYRALSLLALGRFDEAQESFRQTLQGLKTSPQNQHLEPQIRRLHADAAFKAGHYAIAVQEYTTLLQANPQDAALQQLLARAQAGTP